MARRVRGAGRGGTKTKAVSVKPVCLDCGLAYKKFGLDVILPRSQWLAIHPDDHGLLCARCIVIRAATITRAVACHLIIEVAPPPTTLTLRAHAAEHARAVLHACHGNKRITCAQLGISYHTLQALINYDH